MCGQIAIVWFLEQAHLTCHSSVEVDVAEGDVYLSVPASVNTTVDLRSSGNTHIDPVIDTERLTKNCTPSGQHVFGQLGTSDTSWCSAITHQGTISLTVKEWTAGVTLDFLT